MEINGKFHKGRVKINLLVGNELEDIKIKRLIYNKNKSEDVSSIYQEIDKGQLKSLIMYSIIRKDETLKKSLFKLSKTGDTHEEAMKILIKVCKDNEDYEVLQVLKNESDKNTF